MPNNLATRIQMILSDAFTFFVGNFRQIATMCLPFLLGIALFQVILEQAYPASPMAFLASVALDAVIYPIYMGALIQLMARRARQERPTSSALITAAIPQYGRFLSLKIMVSFIIFVGFSTLLVPGIWLRESNAILGNFILFIGMVVGIWIWGHLAFAEFYLVLFLTKPMESIDKSIKSTHKQISLIIALLLLTQVPILILGVAMGSVFVTLMPNPIFQLAFTTGLATLELFVHVVLFRAFMDVMAVQERPQ